MSRFNETIELICSLFRTKNKLLVNCVYLFTGWQILHLIMLYQSYKQTQFVRCSHCSRSLFCQCSGWPGCPCWCRRYLDVFLQITWNTVSGLTHLCNLKRYGIHNWYMVSISGRLWFGSQLGNTDTYMW